MEIKLVPITIKELFHGYMDNGDDGVIGYNGKLDIRPPYQREYVYDLNQSEEVIHTVVKEFPLNIMYWVQKDDGNYEILDGQQRTLSICKYLNHDYDITIEGKRFYWDSLPDDQYQKITNYELMVYICKGTPKEKLDWFEIVNADDCLGKIVINPLMDRSRRDSTRKQLDALFLAASNNLVNPTRTNNERLS